MSSTERLAEIAKKKEQLAQIKRRRQERARNRPPPGSLAGTDLNDVDVDSLVNQLLGESAIQLPKPSSTAGSTNALTESEVQQQQQVQQPRVRTRFRGRSSLAIAEVRHEDILPTEIISYSKGVQTDALPELEENAAGKKEDMHEKQQQNKDEGEEDEEEELQDEDASHREAPEESKDVAQVRVMSEEEVSEVIGTPEFMDFMDSTSRLMERVLNVDYDPLIDYGAVDEAQRDEVAGDAVRLKTEFFSKKWTQGRTVTALDWNPKYSELICAAYNENTEQRHTPDGCVLIWNLHLKDRPERALECQSAVLSCKISPYQPSVIIGGTYSGQVVVWDIREKKNTPHQQSNLNSAYHSHPVFCLDVVGTQNAHSLISLSTDGRLCSWNLDSVLDTQDDVLDLGTLARIAPTTMSFPSNDINNLIVGSEDGSAYQVSRLSSKKDKISEPYAVTGYSGPVTGLQFHPGADHADFSKLFLSSSTDWTVKLWSVEKRQPLTILDYFDDYVYDVQWSPIHPSLFATADGLGNLNFWNFTTDVEVPYTSVQVRGGHTAVNKIKWNNNGTLLAAGDADGYLSIFELSDKMSHPTAETTAQLRNIVADMESSINEEQA
eukprot:m.137706 g.137706  ORF g.137706 m.137706 type:complete len:607 (-) comp12169_c0_seq1:112-1932(-)